jgi:hypothetical protein
MNFVEKEKEIMDFFIKSIRNQFEIILKISNQQITEEEIKKYSKMIDFAKEKVEEFNK